MKDVLCIYYSRTGNTKKAMEEIAGELGAEVVELRDGADRTGWRGWLRCGLDAMRKNTRPVAPVETARPLGEYRLVILGTPVWAGRTSAVMRSFLKERGSSIMRAFLKEHGQELKNVAYVVTRSSDGKFEEVYDQMDLYVNKPRKRAVSICCGTVGSSFWRDEFLAGIRDGREDG